MLRVPVFDEMLFADTLLLLLPAVLQLLEERARPGEQFLRDGDLVHGEAALDQAVGFREEVHPSFDVVHHADIAVFVAAEDEGKFDGGAGVAAVEDDEEGAVCGKSGDKCAVKLVAVELAVGLEIAGNNGGVEAGLAVAVWVFDLAAVAGVVEEVAGVGFGDEPVHGGEHVFAVGEEGAAGVSLLVVAHDDLGFWVAAIAFVAEELLHIFDILVTAAEGVLCADIIDAYQQRLPAKRL